MRVKRSYKMQFKRQVLARVYEIGIDAAIKESNVPRWTVRAWITNKDKIESFGCSQKSKTIKGQGRKEIIPFSHALVLYVKGERRDNNVVTTRMLIEYIKTFQHAWLTEYLRTKKSEDSGQKALMKLCHTFAKRRFYFAGSAYK
ncbi:Sedoheptulokinase [Phytophthora palmivora]|uniref:Sedoheptulokinase n=1 Tax=Phytophthora palmivora TaxID=4796 RepID=A0A2P4X493_9STRA|nr:Sedoheptulokinase [Phytophthora palmivora]